MTVLELRDLLNAVIEAQPANAEASVYTNGQAFTFACPTLKYDEQFQANEIRSIFIGNSDIDENGYKTYFVDKWLQVRQWSPSSYDKVPEIDYKKADVTYHSW